MRHTAARARISHFARQINSTSLRRQPNHLSPTTQAGPVKRASRTKEQLFGFVEYADLVSASFWGRRSLTWRRHELTVMRRAPTACQQTQEVRVRLLVLWLEQLSSSSSGEASYLLLAPAPSPRHRPTPCMPRPSAASVPPTPCRRPHRPPGRRVLSTVWGCTMGCCGCLASLSTSTSQTTCVVVVACVRVC